MGLRMCLGVAGEEDETASPKRYLLRERRRHELQPWGLQQEGRSRQREV